jgi:hypothetical protein
MHVDLHYVSNHPKTRHILSVLVLQFAGAPLLVLFEKGPPPYLASRDLIYEGCLN